ncbi:hypothetical protein EDB89DRAFT_2021362 [Lactarius sanguifluus]|nr:hypothetical protein EDB89DRAFT_2021362 [Lactarius sanguifluus]
MLERISSAEAERDQLRAKVDEIQALMLLNERAGALLELTELRRVRAAPRCSRANMPHAALQRHYKEQETRIASSGRAASTARASLVQAQQRAAARSRMGATGERVRGVARGRAAGARAGGGLRGAARREGRRGAPCTGTAFRAVFDVDDRGDRERIVVSASRFAHQHGVFQSSVNGQRAGTTADVRVRLDACVAQ